MSGFLDFNHKVDKNSYDYFGISTRLARLITRVSLFSFLIAVPKGKATLIKIPDEELTEDEKFLKMTLAVDPEYLKSLGLHWRESKIGRKYWQYKDENNDWHLIRGVYIVEC